MVGKLKIKVNDGGNRHYIALPDGSHDDIRCGSMIDVQLGKWVEDGDGEKLVPSGWLRGRYESDLISEHPKARLIIGDFYPYNDERVAQLFLPLGVNVRRSEGWENNELRGFIKALEENNLSGWLNR